jgi:HSP20 family protein
MEEFMTETSETKNTDVEQTRQSSVSPFRSIEQFFNELSPRGWLRDWPSISDIDSKLSLRSPNIDIVDRDTEIIVKAEIPGIDKKDLEINVSDSSITIKGETKSETREEKDNVIHSEIHKGSFLRTVPLPCQVDASAAKANFKDGILNLTLPKTNDGGSRRIEVE